MRPCDAGLRSGANRCGRAPSRARKRLLRHHETTGHRRWQQAVRALDPLPCGCLGCGDNGSGTSVHSKQQDMGEARRTYDDKLERLLRIAAAVFAEKGYHPASIRDISRATGTSLSGLYYYFRSKEELLFLIQDHCFTTVLENLQARLRGVAAPDERLRILVHNHLRFFAANMNEMKVLSHEAASL